MTATTPFQPWKANSWFRRAEALLSFYPPGTPVDPSVFASAFAEAWSSGHDTGVEEAEAARREEEDPSR